MRASDRPRHRTAFMRARSIRRRPNLPLLTLAAHQKGEKMAQSKYDRMYVLELNRPRWDNIRACARWLQRNYGLAVQILPHKTSIRITRPKHVSWLDFKKAVRAIIQPRRGSAMIFSQRPGNVYVCSNRANRPGHFQPI
jgi:hypothetical protein